METNFLVYDDQCSFCTSLAGMAKRISTAQKINITKWTDFKQSELAKRLLSEIEIKAVLPDALLLVTGM